MKRKRTYSTILILLSIALSMTSGLAWASDWIKKPVTSRWTWFEDYVFVYATYTVACSPNCSCQVGMGVKAFGEPMGEKIKFSQLKEITVIGLGAIHIKSVESEKGCKAALRLGEYGTVPLLDIKW